MNLTKDQKTGKWLCQFYYTDWQGNRKKKFKRGFRTKAEAEAWAREFLQKQESNLDMRFDQFLELYYEDMEKRLKESTVRTKKYIIDLKIRCCSSNYLRLHVALYLQPFSRLS